MIVPLGIEAYQRSLRPSAQLLNMFLEVDKSGASPDNTMRVQRPGLTQVYNLPGPIRGISYRSKTEQSMIVGGADFHVDGVSVGSIAGEGIAPMVATSFFHVTLGGGRVYLYDSTLVQVEMPDNRTVQDIDQLNQYILMQCYDGRFYWIVPGETTVDPLNFATAESAGDAALALRRVGDEFWIFGTETVEVWQPTGDQDAPFQPVAGRAYQRGCLARDTVRRFDNSIMWVSSDLEVCRGGAVPEVVSDNAISERLRTRSSDPSAFVFKHDGHEFYVLRIPGEGTFVYDALTRKWCEFSSSQFQFWRPHVGAQLGSSALVGDSQSGVVWRIDGESATDAGVIMRRVVTGAVALIGKPPRNDSLSIGVGASDDCQIRIRWRDGQDNYPPITENLDIRAPFDVATLYRLGMPEQPYREIEVTCVDPVRVVIAGCVVGEGWKGGNAPA